MGLGLNELRNRKFFATKSLRSGYHCDRVHADTVFCGQVSISGVQLVRHMAWVTCTVRYDWSFRPCAVVCCSRGGLRIGTELIPAAKGRRQFYQRYTTRYMHACQLLEGSHVCPPCHSVATAAHVGPAMSSRVWNSFRRCRHLG
ncbi:hypothetical protein PG989_010040 [Apiospora arundinis]